MNKNIVVLENLLYDSPELGNKVKNTAILSREGIRVPRSIGLKYDMYVEQMKDMIPHIKDIIVKTDDYSVMAEEIYDFIVNESFKYAEDVSNAIVEYMPNAKYFAVRSSGAPFVKGKELIEDSSGVSLAGQYESYLEVPVEHISKAIMCCYASLFSERVLRAFDVKNDLAYLDSRMSVLIQEMFSSDLCAVVMTKDPVELEEVFGIEITYGACEALVSGKVQGDLFLLNRRNGGILDRQIGSKSVCMNLKPFDGNAADNVIITETPDYEKSMFSASQEIISKIFDIGMKIENIFGTPQDIELVVFNNDIGVVQTRPITARSS